MRIGMLCNWNYGGSAVVAAELGKQLACRGHRVHFISAEKPFRLEEYYPNTYLHQPGQFDYPVFATTPFFLLQLTKIIEVVKEQQIDILHAHYAIPHCLTAIFARQIIGEPIPVITTLHGTDITLVGQNKEFYQITKYGLESSDVLTAVSNSLAEETRLVFNLKESPRVVYNFLDTKFFWRRFDNDLRQSYASNHEKVIIHISNFRPVKRVPAVIDIFCLINEHVPCKLLLVGNGPEMANVKKKVIALNLNSKVHFIEQKNDIMPLLSISDLMLLPSELESFGLAALEALACGVPVVASNVGGLPEVVQHGVTGFLAEYSDVTTMSKYAIKILSNHDLLQKMRFAGRAWVESKFSADYWVSRYEDLYYSMLAGKK